MAFELDTTRQVSEYKFFKQSTIVPKIRNALIVYLAVFQAAFIVLYAILARYESNKGGDDTVKPLYPMFMDVHSMMFVGFGFLMTFLKKYGFSSITFNFLIAAYVLEWAILVRGWMYMDTDDTFEISVEKLLYADFCSAAILISMGAVLGKTSLTQLVIMATFEVVLQNVNEFIGVHLLGASDIGGSIFVHVFGAYFGMAVAKVLNTKEVESSKESSSYSSDLFSMIGTLFLWLYWPSFNSAVAINAGQSRAVINTFLSISASTITTVIVSMLVCKRKLNMVHIQNATLAGGVAVGAVADLAVQPYGALLIGSFSGVLSVIGYEYLTPLLKRINLHDTCGVNNLHGMPGLMSGLLSALFAMLAREDTKNYTKQGLKDLYPKRFNETYHELRTAQEQGGIQMAALGITLAIAIVGGCLTGLIMRLPIMERIREEELMFDDEPAFLTPEDYSSDLANVTVQRDGEELKGVSRA